MNACSYKNQQQRDGRILNVRERFAERKGLFPFKWNFKMTH